MQEIVRGQCLSDTTCKGCYSLQSAQLQASSRLTLQHLSRSPAHVGQPTFVTPSDLHSGKRYSRGQNASILVFSHPALAFELPSTVRMSESRKPPPTRQALQRSRSNFLTRTATDTVAQLDRRFSTVDEQQPLLETRPLTNASKPASHRHELTTEGFNSNDGVHGVPIPIRRTSSGRRRSSHGLSGDASRTANTPKLFRSKSQDDTVPTPRIGSLPRPIGGHEKLGTFSGVFVPTTLNVLSILMFLRFGFILGQSGVLGMMGEIFIPYTAKCLCLAALPWSNLTRCMVLRDAYRFICHQSRYNAFNLGNCNERYSAWWGRLLPYISFLGTRVWGVHRNRTLSGVRFQHRLECRRSDRLSEADFWRDVRLMVSMATGKLLVGVSVGYHCTCDLHRHLSSRKWHLCKV